MNKTICWFCGKEFEYDGEQYRDVNCSFCGIENSIYNPYQAKQEFNKPNTTEEEWLERKEKNMILTGKRNFLRVSDVKGGEIITFLNEGEWVENKKYTYPDGTPRKDFVIKITIFELEKDMRLNATNRSNLISAFGNDTTNWIGKSAILEKTKVMVGGKIMDTIIVKPIKEEEPAL